jgi:hypothetical protein
MTSEEAAIAEAIFDLSVGSRCPYQTILDSGAMPAGWAEDYFSQLALVSKTWSKRSEIPMKVATAVHAASLYLAPRYQAWRNFHPGSSNNETDSAIARIRTRSELFLMGPLTPNIQIPDGPT